MQQVEELDSLKNVALCSNVARNLIQVQEMDTSWQRSKKNAKLYRVEIIKYYKVLLWIGRKYNLEKLYNLLICKE